MSNERTWALTDVDQQIWQESLVVKPEDVGAAAGDWSMRKQRLRGGLTDGVDIVELNNGELSVTVVPTRGMGIHNCVYHGDRIGWDSPVTGPVNPMFVNLTERGGLGWLNGFDELMVRCGLDSHGAPCRDRVVNNSGDVVEVDLTLHGKIANIPAHKVDLSVNTKSGELAVTGEVDEVMMLGLKYRLTSRTSTVAGSNKITVSDRIQNLMAAETEMEVLYHWNFGPPILEEGSQVVLPVEKVAPRAEHDAKGIDTIFTYHGPIDGFVEQAYWYKLKGEASGDTAVLLRNAAGDKGVVQRFNLKQLPCFTQWKNTAAKADGYVTGLEPGSSHPQTKTNEREKGRLVNLGPGESYEVTQSLECLDTADAVATVEAEIAAIQGGTPPNISPVPIPEF